MGRFLYQTVDVFVRSFSRGYSSAATGQLGQLRKKTGFALKNCKKALEKCDYNVEEAEKWLYEQAQAEGWAKAGKLQSRPMSSGLLGLIKNSNGATMIEVNCETDFVAKNEKFKNLVYRLTAACHSNMTKDNSKTRFIPQADVSNISHEGKTLADLVALEIGIIGENMRLRRAVYVPATEEKYVDSYIHSSEENISIEGCKMGRFGSILQYSRTTPERTIQESTGTNEDQGQLESSEEEPIEEITKGLCLHIIGHNPKSIGDSENDKPSKNKNEENKLIFQEYMSDEDITVGQLLKEKGVVVEDFVRFECGEELHEKSS